VKQPLILASQYYLLLLLYNIAFTLTGTALVCMSAGHLTGAVFLCGKVLGFAGATGLYHFSAQPSYFYFRNAGYDMKTIIAIAFTIDIIACFLIIAIVAILLSWIHLF